MTWWAKARAVGWIYTSKAFSVLALKCDRWAEGCMKRATALIPDWPKAPPPS